MTYRAGRRSGAATVFGGSVEFGVTDWLLELGAGPLFAPRSWRACNTLPTRARPARVDAGGDASRRTSGGGSMAGTGKSRRGFASMDPSRQREIASKGGRAAHEKGTAHEWSSDEARV